MDIMDYFRGMFAPVESKDEMLERLRAEAMLDLGQTAMDEGRGLRIPINKSFDDVDPEPLIQEEPKSEKPGWSMAEGTNFWSVNEKDPHWQTEEGYQEAMNLYGFKPGWVTRPVEKENKFVNLQPTKRISL